MPLRIRYANIKDEMWLKLYDKHIQEEQLHESILTNKILLILDNDSYVGWLRYNFFWDQIPFINMLYILKEYQNKGYGRQLMDYFEHEMALKKHKLILTSSLSNEMAQNFYRKLKYKDCGSLLLLNEPLEIIFYKNLKKVKNEKN